MEKIQNLGKTIEYNSYEMKQDSQQMEENLKQIEEITDELQWKMKIKEDPRIKEIKKLLELNVAKFG